MADSPKAQWDSPLETSKATASTETPKGTGVGPPRSSRAPIEVLPSELLFYLSRFLDLAGLIVFSTATSHALRDTFAQFDRELLFLEPVHRLNLAEWREAARQIERVGLTQSASVERSTSKEDIHLSQAVHQLTRDESLIDLHLLQSILGFLTGESLQRFDTGARSGIQRDPLEIRTSKLIHGPKESNRQIRSLHLTGWHGIAGAFLIQQLRSQPSLSNVCTVVKTDRADSRIWHQAAADDRCLQARIYMGGLGSQAYMQHGYGAPFGQRRPRSAQNVFGPSSVLWFNECNATEIIVQVGKRRPRRPGQPYLRGEGLQMGYQGYCIDMTTATQDAGEVSMVTLTEGSNVSADGCSDAEPKLANAAGTSPIDTAESLDLCSQALANGRRLDAMRKKLHVILQGREVEDAGQNEEMFERSIVSCNHCKERIGF